MTFTPRDYQLEAAAAFAAHEGTRNGVIVLPTGTGKTVTGHLCALPYLQAGKRVLWIAHTNELVTQPLVTLNEKFPGYVGGVVQGKRDEASAQIVYASKDTLKKPERLARLLVHGDFALVVVDEAHHAPAASWKVTVDALKARGAKVLGLTATPERGDAKPLSIDWEIVYSLSIMDAIAMGALVPPYVAVDLVKGFDPTQVKITRGEYDAGDLDLHLREHIIKHTVDAIGKVHTWSRLPLHDNDVTTEIKGSIIVYTPTVELGKLTVEALRGAGYNAAVVWGEMPPGERRARLAEFLSGELRILVNACMLVEGTDLPITEAVVIGMPIRKRGRYMQIVGRCVRLFNGKHRGLVLDLCGSSSEHSIVSAPVIISGTDCEASADGQHRYSEIHGSREGRCDHCQKVVKCYQSAGPHRFKDGRCSKCGADQCGSSPTKEHVYMVVADFTRGCVHCGVEVVDPLSRLAGREAKYKEKVAWKKLARLPGELYFVHLGRIGLMFNRRTETGWLPTLVDNDGAKPLSRGPVDERIARLLTDDIARRGTVVNGEFGGQKTPTAMKYACLKAEDIAKRLRL
jgi:superfamily II DNA or RNA helicase